MRRCNIPCALLVRVARLQGEPPCAQVPRQKTLTVTLPPPAFRLGDGEGRLGTTPGGTVNAVPVWVRRQVRGAV